MQTPTKLWLYIKQLENFRKFFYKKIFFFIKKFSLVFSIFINIFKIFHANPYDSWSSFILKYIKICFFFFFNKCIILLFLENFFIKKFYLVKKNKKLIQLNQVNQKIYNWYVNKLKPKTFWFIDKLYTNQN